MQESSGIETTDLAITNINPGTVDDFQKTIRFVEEVEIQVWQQEYRDIVYKLYLVV